HFVGLGSTTYIRGRESSGRLRRLESKSYVREEIKTKIKENIINIKQKNKTKQIIERRGDRGEEERATHSRSHCLSFVVVVVLVLKTYKHGVFFIFCLFLLKVLSSPYLDISCF